MTILAMNRKELERIAGKIDEKVITDMGTPVEYINDQEVAVEIFPNRPDLLSLQNFGRALLQYKGKGKIAEFKVHPPEKDYQVIIDKSVKGIRNHTVCCIVRGIKFNDEKIKEIIDIQEKMHGSLGRRRKKVAIGVYPLEKIKLPITFKAEDPSQIKFQPLEFPREITGRQILSQHPTGREYGDLLKGFDKFPFFVDASGEVLSMPPIINSERTGRITDETKDIFIECSGNSLYYQRKILNIIVAALYEMGGKVYAMKIVDKKDGSFESPDMRPEELQFKIEDINKNIGIEFSEKQIKNLLARMGIGYKLEKNKSIAIIPAYRTDILHWIDLVEEVAIAYGYDNLEPVIPKISTIAEEDNVSKTKRVIGNVLAGAGLLEVSTFHLTTKKNIKKIHFDHPVENLIEVEDSKTEREVLRHDILTNLMQIFSENSDSQYPQKIFELGRVFEKDNSVETGVREIERLAVALVDEKISFTEIKQILDYLFKMLDVAYTLEEYDDHPAFIKGRSGAVKVNNKVIGYIGEIAPRVLRNWKVKVPGAAFEINTDVLFL